MQKKWTLKEIEKYYNTKKLPETIDLPVGRIDNVREFYVNHIKVLHANSGNSTYLPYFERLIEVINIIEKNGNDD